MEKKILTDRLAECGITVSEIQAEKLCRYHEMLMDWNTRMDLTAVTEESEMLDRHYADSLSAIAAGLIPETGSLIDVGTGAGFPGMPLAICRPGLRVTLLDAQQKRLNFLQAVTDELGLENVTIVHARAEDGARMPELRERFDLAAARAVAPLNVLAEYLLPYVRVGGRAVCWKGPALAQELDEGRRAAFLLGARIGEAVNVTFPGREWQHTLQVLEKNGSTPRIYPRKAGTPGKKPLGAAKEND